MASNDQLFGGVRVVHVPGIQGAAGPEGPEGPVGPQGDRGPIGERGPQGPQGVMGPQGPQGEKGDSFTPDATGPRDSRSSFDNRPRNFTYLATDTAVLYYKLSDSVGDWSEGVSLRGDTGLTGPQGPKGDKGDVGPQGLQGEKGEKGDKGDQGDVGPQGPRGFKGDTGEQGPQGEAGVDGTNYSPDYKGPANQRYVYDDYVRGTSYFAWDTGMLYFKKSNSSADWTEGIAFGQGPVGPKGDKGDKGDQGDQGEKGDRGIQGIQGEKGADGKSVNEFLMDPDPELYFLEVYGETHGDIIGDLVVQEDPFDPDPVNIFDEVMKE